VWLVMKGDSYTPGALTAAYSLRLTGSPHDTVCMVTADVSAAARSRLSLVFSHVVEVEYISAQTRPLKTGKQQQLYARWVEQAFTKWSARLAQHTLAITVSPRSLSSLSPSLLLTGRA
jgi:hypothetical protein